MTNKNKIEEIFSKVSKEELQAYLLSQITENRHQKNAFIGYFAEHLDEDINKKYRVSVRNIYLSAQDHYGFIDYRSTDKLSTPLDNLICKAHDLNTRKKVAEALAICKAIIEQVPEFISNVDDSCGSVGMLFEDSFDLFHEMAEDAPLKLKDELLSYCLKEFTKQKYSDFCFESYFLNVIPLLINSTKQEKQFFKIIDEQLIKAKSKRNPSYDIVKFIQVKIDYLLLKGREDELQVLLKENKQYPEFREILMQNALDNENFKLAIELSEQGLIIAQDEEHPGIVNQWHKWLLKIAELEKNKAGIRKWSEVLYDNSYRDMDYYKKLKFTYSEKDWEAKCESIIDDIKTKNQYGGCGLAKELADVFIAEKYFDRLLKLLQTNPTEIDLIDRYAHHLIDKHSEQIIDLYASGVISHAEQTGRPIYRQVSTYIKTMSTIPGSEFIINELIQYFRGQYKNRPAMMDVLRRGFPNQFK